MHARVFVRGAGVTPVTRSHAASRLEDMAQTAIAQAVATSGITLDNVTCLVVGNMLAPVLQKQSQLATLIASSHAELNHVETVTVDAACASGGAALRQGVLAVRSGAHKNVLVLGIEQMSDPDHKHLLAPSLAQASHWETEGSLGQTFIGLNSMLTTEYVERHGYSSDEFFAFPSNAHHNATTSLHALFKKPLSRDDYLGSQALADNIRLFDACPTCSGCAALVLSSDGASSRDPVILASASRSDTIALKNREDLLELRALKLSAQAAFAESGLAHNHVGLYETHDAYSVMSALCLEAAGFCAPGQGVLMGKAGDIALDGRLPVSTFGGLKARGHPVGASGVYQAVEAWMQLTERAGRNQVAFAHSPRVAMMSSFGGAATTCVTHIMAV